MSFKFENLTILSGEILRSTESRIICFSYDQNDKNSLKSLISVEKKFGRSSSCRNGIRLRFFANKGHMCSISYYFQNFSASINNVTTILIYIYSCKMPQYCRIAIQKTDPVTRVPWKPWKYDVVCSAHFKDIEYRDSFYMSFCVDWIKRLYYFYFRNDSSKHCFQCI